jgi:hypothetical protein
MLTFRVGVLRAVLLVAACGGGSGGPVDPNGTAFGITATGPGVLAVSPIDTASVIWTTPLGSIAPPGHVLPTDHVYISFVDAYSGNQQNNDCMTKRPIYAAGSGVIEFTIVTETRGDTKVSVQMTKTFHYYYDHVLLLPGFVVGTRVSAGQQIATTAGGCPSFDIGVWDLEATNGGFVNPARYGASTLHATSPYKYFTAPLRAVSRSLPSARRCAGEQRWPHRLGDHRKARRRLVPFIARGGREQLRQSGRLVEVDRLHVRLVRQFQTGDLNRRNDYHARRGSDCGDRSRSGDHLAIERTHRLSHCPGENGTDAAGLAPRTDDGVRPYSRRILSRRRGAPCRVHRRGAGLPAIAVRLAVRLAVRSR